MTTFICIECSEPFEVKDTGIVQSMVYEHLATGDGFVCRSCSSVTVDLEGACPLYSFEKEEKGEK